MNPTTLAFLVGVLLGVPGGLLLNDVFGAAGRARAVQRAYLAGLEKGEALAGAKIMHDLIASDTAAAFPQRPAA